MNCVIFYKNSVRYLEPIWCKFIVQKFRSNLKSESMATNNIGYWNGKKQQLKQIYSNITDEDLSYYEGKEKEMIELLGYKLGKSQEEIRDIITELK
jgi:hypothetical protein